MTGSLIEILEAQKGNAPVFRKAPGNYGDGFEHGIDTAISILQQVVEVLARELSLMRCVHYDAPMRLDYFPAEEALALIRKRLGGGA